MADSKPKKSSLSQGPKKDKDKDSKSSKDSPEKEMSPEPEKSPSRSKSPEKQKSKPKKGKTKTGPCPWLCNLVPVDLPPPDAAQTVLHPRKDVFILKVAKVGAKGDRRCKMELELVTPKGPEKQALCRIDTRETQCDPDPPPCTCCTRVKKKRKHG